MPENVVEMLWNMNASKAPNFHIQQQVRPCRELYRFSEYTDKSNRSQDIRHCTLIRRNAMWPWWEQSPCLPPLELPGASPPSLERKRERSLKHATFSVSPYQDDSPHSPMTPANQIAAGGGFTFNRIWVLLIILFPLSRPI